MRIKQVFLNLSLDDLEMTSELYTEVEIKPIIGRHTAFELICDKEARTANLGFAIAGVTCFVDTFVVNGSVVLRRNISATSPRHRKLPKRCAS